MKKVLIIKTGYSETLTPEVEEYCSLGDVFRTTAILHLFKGDSVTWLTDEKAVDLLQGNPYITRLLKWSLDNYVMLRNEEFDIVINLEKVPGMCALGSVMNAWDKYGFRFDARTGKAEAFRDSTEALYIATDKKRKQSNDKHWLQLLYEMMDKEWRGEDYILPGVDLDVTYTNTVGLNYRVGRKFEGKDWGIDNFVLLERDLKEMGYDVKWQAGFDNIRAYIQWISSCGVIVTNDSLGLHLAIALKKPMVALFGPTPSSEIHPYKPGIFIQKEKITDITVMEVVKSVEGLYPCVI